MRVSGRSWRSPKRSRVGTSPIFGCAIWDHEFRVAYPSLGEFVFMLCVAPWEIPEFEVERDLDALLAFESDCLTDDGLVVTECRYLIDARKPG